MRPMSLIFALTAAASLGGCAQQPDIAAEERTIRGLEKQWVQAVAAKDTTAIGNVYAEDGEFLPPGAPRVSGRAAVRSAGAGILKAPNLMERESSRRSRAEPSKARGCAVGSCRAEVTGPSCGPTPFSSSTCESRSRPTTER